MALFSIGHSNHAGPRFLQLLEAARIEVLVDVRSLPASRLRPQFNRAALERALGAAGIEYRHAPALGGRGGTRVDDPAFRAAMRDVLAQASARAVALMCAERDPARCHRTTKLAAWLHRHEPDRALVHLLPRPDGTLERTDSRALEARLAPSLIWPELRLP